MSRRPFLTIAATGGLALSLAAALAGCSVLAGVVGSTPGSASTSKPSPTATGAATPRADPTRARVVIDCDLVLSNAHAAELTPPLTPIATFAPAPGTLGATMADQGGRACGWGADATASLEVVVAIPTAAGLKSAESAAASVGQVASASLADAAYFAVADGVGRAQIFMGSYWIEVASPAFTTPEQASDVYSIVIQDLRSAGG